MFASNSHKQDKQNFQKATLQIILEFIAHTNLKTTTLLKSNQSLVLHWFNLSHNNTEQFSINHLQAQDKPMVFTLYRTQIHYSLFIISYLFDKPRCHNFILFLILNFQSMRKISHNLVMYWLFRIFKIRLHSRFKIQNLLFSLKVASFHIVLQSLLKL